MGIDPVRDVLERATRAAASAETIKYNGKVTQVVGLTIESHGPVADVGELCYIYPKRIAGKVQAEVMGFRGERVLLMPLGEMEGIGPGSEVVATGAPFTVGVGPGLLGRVVDGLGNPIDGRGFIEHEAYYRTDKQPPRPLKREGVKDPLAVGVRAIDGLLTCGRGQRVGIFAGSGIGKSSLLGMIARNTEADVNVIALVGERGREVRAFLEKDLGSEGLKKSVVVAATSDQPALLRIKAAFVATTYAEYFRDQGLHVMLLMDSVTRFAMAQREVGLAIGEPPTSRGYTPSVFALLPKLLERSGTSERGTITGFYSVLVEADDLNEPITDAVRGILDGHIVLSRELASRNHYPAIDVLASVSRLMPDVATPEHLAAAARFRDMLAAYREAEELINIGAYKKGNNPRVDKAVELIGALESFLRQELREKSEYDATLDDLTRITATEVKGH